MRYSAGIVTALVSLTYTVAAQDGGCDEEVTAPISLPVHNVTLAGNHIRRGLEVHIGTPPQIFALGVTGINNNTYLQDESGDCGYLPEVQCTSIRGGAFVESDSHTWNSKSVSDLTKLDAWTKDPSIDQTWLAGEDTLTLNSSLKVENYPIGIPRGASYDQSIFGMGKDSTILTALRNLGSIASRSFFIYWGQTGITPEHQTDGSFLMGGYDEAKVTGDNYTTKLQHGSACPSGMLISVSDMELVYPNGTSASILSGAQISAGQSINYCLRTEFPHITMNEAVWEQWMEIDPDSITDGNSEDRATGHPNLWGLVYPIERIFPGDLKITIDHSLEITIPNHQLVQNYYVINTDGDPEVNATFRELMIDPLQGGNADDMPQFGMTFFQAAAMFVNYDTDELTLWNAVPTKDEKLVGVGKSTRGCATTPNTTNTNSNSNSNSDGATTEKISKKSSLSGGAIAGIVVGVIAVLALVGLLAFFLFRKRQSLKSDKHANVHATELGRNSYMKAELETPLHTGYYQPELSSSTEREKSELPGHFPQDTRGVPATGAHAASHVYEMPP